MSLTASHLHFQYREKALLQDIHLTLKPGELTVLLGPNGAGKSTLLRIFSGELIPTQGEMHLHGRPREDWTLRQQAQSVAVLPQRSHLSFPLSALNVVLLGRIAHPTGQAENRQIALKCLARVDASHLANRYYQQLSGGECQRVQLARVLAQVATPIDFGDRYLLLDEPTSALDLAHQHLLLSQAQALAQEGLGVLMILHDLNLAAQYADRVVLMQSGKIVANATPQAVLTAPRIEQVFDLPVQVQQHPGDSEKVLIMTTALQLK